MGNSEIAARYDAVLENIDKAATRIGRSSENITLVVVTKTHPVDSIKEVILAGGRDFGENYVQDAVPKIQFFEAESNINWHMVGHIQSRKANQVAELFDYVHSIDRKKIADKLNGSLKQIKKVLPVLLEINVSGEESKFGWDATDQQLWSQLIEQIAPIFEFPWLDVKGLMTMAPYSPNSEDSRKSFWMLRKLLEYINAQFPSHQMAHLSMGMSGDYQVAIEEGATILRIGSAIMGNRSSAD